MAHVQTLTISNAEVKVPRKWKVFLSSGCNKEALLSFLASHWETCVLPTNFTLFTTCGTSCKELNFVNSQLATSNDVPALNCDHEEADTRLVAHALHASQQSFQTVIVSSPDTNVAIMCLGHACHFKSLGFLTGTKTKRRIIDIVKCSQALGKEMQSSLVGLHAFTGCDSVSSFSGKGKKTSYA